MKLKFRWAEDADLGKAIAFYQAVCVQQKYDQYGPDWHWGIYPTGQGLAKRIAAHELFLGMVNEQIAVAGFITRGDDPSLKSISWKNPVPNHEIAVLHLFAAGQDFRGQGLATQMLNLLKAACRQQGMNAIYLDVMKGNLAAENLYKKAGFVLAAEKKLPYQDLDPTPARIFECKL